MAFSICELHGKGAVYGCGEGLACCWIRYVLGHPRHAVIFKDGDRVSRDIPIGRVDKREQDDYL